MTGRPNVIFILSDQHNAKLLGCKGHPHVRTPHLDGMAARGVRFENAITQNTICTPSRVSHLSGQYCHNHGYYGLSGPNPGGLPTVLGHFRKAGYRTAAVGKIHCPEYWVEDDCDEFHETTFNCSIGGRSPEYLRYLREQGVDDIDSDFKIATEGAASPHPYEHSEEGWSARKTIDIARRAAADGKPFFIHFSLTKPHGPYTPAKRFWDLYDESKLTLPPNADYDREAARKSPLLISVTKWTRNQNKDWKTERMRKLHGYLGNVTHVDFAIGEVLRFLDESGLADDTIVVYSSDHGDYACEHGPNEKVPGICVDAVTRIPMVWQWPGRFKAGHVARDIVEAVDVVPTLCALGGLDPLLTADGRDISHVLRGEPGDPDRLGVTEYALSKSVRKGKWRLVYYPDGFFQGVGPDRFGELYDLDADPWETKNVYFEPQHADRVRQLERELLNWLVSTTRPRTLLSQENLSGDQVVRRFHHPITADGKIPYQQFRLGLPEAPHL